MKLRILLLDRKLETAKTRYLSSEAFPLFGFPPVPLLCYCYLSPFSTRLGWPVARCSEGVATPANRSTIPVALPFRRSPQEHAGDTEKHSTGEDISTDFAPFGT